MKTSLAVVRHVPEFVRADYPAFVQFIQAYYKWYEDVFVPGHIEQLLDIDQTIDEYLKYFRAQLDIYGITLNATNQRQLLRNIKQLYQSKGSFVGIEFLLRLMFDTDTDVSTPWDYVFKPSDGKWYQDISILTRILQGDAQQLIGNSVVFTDVTGRTYKTSVKAVNIKPSGTVEVFVNRFNNLGDIVTFASSDGSVFGSCLKTTTKVKVVTAGKGFHIGQVFTANTNSGNGTLVKVKQVTTDGAIRAVEIITFGTGYSTDFNIIISPQGSLNPSALGARIQLADLTYKTDDNANMQNERGILVKHNYTNLSNSYMTDPTYVGEIAGEITTQDNIQMHDANYAILQFTVGSLAVYPGYYRTNDNIIGDVVIIQDSTYYQAFSYVTSLEVELNRYANVLRSVMHPAGTKHFATYQMNYDFQLTPIIDPTLNIVSKEDALRDLVAVFDDIKFSMQAVFQTQFASVTDAFNRVVSYIRNPAQNPQFAQVATVTDAIAKSFSKYGITDVATITDAISLIPNFPRSDVVTVTDAITTFSGNKYISDTILTGFGDTSGVYKTPYYADPETSAYWKPGYTTDERAFTN